MERKTINFIFALVVGKSSTGPIINMKLDDIWDNKPAVEFFISSFIPSINPFENTKSQRINIKT